jgi:uncharacterized surface protein with fasciclin (FAS1) repeats
MSMTRRFLPAIGAVALSAAIVTAPGMAHSHTSAPKPTKNIVQIASGDANFSTLVSLVKEAGLVGALSAKGPYTVFAPTNAAFAKVPAETLAALKANPDQLKAVLTYHVLGRSLPAPQITKFYAVKTLQGSGLKIRTAKGTVRVNTATVIKPNVMASNGVIHVINQVLIPPAK